MLRILFAIIVSFSLASSTLAQTEAISKAQFQVVKQAFTFDESTVGRIALNKKSDKEYELIINLTNDGAKKLKSLTEKNVNQRMQLILGKSILLDAVIKNSLGARFVMILESAEKAQKLMQTLRKAKSE